MTPARRAVRTVTTGSGGHGVAAACATSLVALTVILTLAVPLCAQAATGPRPTTLSVAFEGSAVAGVPDYLVARLTLADGSAVEGAEVTILRKVELGGERSVVLGTATTDRAGNARIPVTPREPSYRVIVRFVGSDALAGSEITADIPFPPALVIHPDAAPRGGVVDPRLRPLADLMPSVIGGSAALIWVVLLVTTGVTLRQIAAHGRRGSAAAASVIDPPKAGKGIAP